VWFVRVNLIGAMCVEWCIATVVRSSSGLCGWETCGIARSGVFVMILCC